MLIQHDVEHQADARLPKRLAHMDIRDLIKPESDTAPQVEYISPPSSQVQRTDNTPMFRSSISLPSLPAPHLVLPSPSDLTKFTQGSSASASSQAAICTQPGQQPLPSHQFFQTPVYQQAQSQQRVNCWPNSLTPNKRASPPDDNRSGPPPKRQSKWNPEEDRKIIAYRGQGMKWSEISARLYPRTEIGCRLHYQNYLEKRSDWDEEKKNKLARVYERVKEDMWKLVANEMKIPWRSAEGMHWIMGETEMARRANVTPFSNTIQPSSTSSTTATVCSSASTGEMNHHRAPIYHDNGNTIIFEPEHLATFNALPGTNVSTGPVSTFATARSSLQREHITSKSHHNAAIKAYTDQSIHGHPNQHPSQEISKDHTPPSPRSDRAMRDISPRTYQAIRERRARLPSVSEMECMVPIPSSTLTTSTGNRLRKRSEDASSVNSRYSSNGSASVRAEEGNR